MAWIGNLPGGIEPVISFTELTRAERHSVIKLAESLCLSTTGEDDQVDTLNKIMYHLGVSRRRFAFFLPAIHQMTIDTLRLGTKAYHHERGCCDAGNDKPLMLLTEVPLYMFFAYLTVSVYSSIILYVASASLLPLRMSVFLVSCFSTEGRDEMYPTDIQHKRLNDDVKCRLFRLLFGKLPPLFLTWGQHTTTKSSHRQGK